ncbi:hypothetical protein T439DRAFT_355920 [Meredithblackwellia eburnea MCA 4105]
MEDRRGKGVRPNRPDSRSDSSAARKQDPPQLSGTDNERQRSLTSGSPAGPATDKVAQDINDSSSSSIIPAGSHPFAPKLYRKTTQGRIKPGHYAASTHRPPPIIQSPLTGSVNSHRTQQSFGHRVPSPDRTPLRRFHQRQALGIPHAPQRYKDGQGPTSTGSQVSSVVGESSEPQVPNPESPPRRIMASSASRLPVSTRKLSTSPLSYSLKSQKSEEDNASESDSTTVPQDFAPFDRRARTFPRARPLSRPQSALERRFTWDDNEHDHHGFGSQHRKVSQDRDPAAGVKLRPTPDERDQLLKALVWIEVAPLLGDLDSVIDWTKSIHVEWNEDFPSLHLWYVSSFALFRRDLEGHLMRFTEQAFVQDHTGSIHMTFRWQFLKDFGGFKEGFEGDLKLVREAKVRMRSKVQPLGSRPGSRAEL